MIHFQSLQGSILCDLDISKCSENKFLVSLTNLPCLLQMFYSGKGSILFQLIKVSLCEWPCSDRSVSALSVMDIDTWRLHIQASSTKQVTELSVEDTLSEFSRATYALIQPRKHRTLKGNQISTEAQQCTNTTKSPHHDEISAT